jgi:hypothetical protein
LVFTDARERDIRVTLGDVDDRVAVLERSVACDVPGRLSVSHDP